MKGTKKRPWVFTSDKLSFADVSAKNDVLQAKLLQDESGGGIYHLEKALQEERLYSRDLKMKLQAANRQTESIKAKLDAVENSSSSSSSGKAQSAVSVLKAESSCMERSQSMNDLGGKEVQQKGESPPSQYHLPRLTTPKQHR
jgi:hypothetical protein